jgi:hypothetical protein
VGFVALGRPWLDLSQVLANDCPSPFPTDNFLAVLGPFVLEKFSAVKHQNPPWVAVVGED